jgi:hypothetical protein
MKTNLSLVGALALTVAACGGNSPAPETPPPASSATPAASGTMRPLTQAQLEVAHYKSADGMHGFVLDRTGDKAKLRIDGQTDIIELTRHEDRHSGTLRGYWLVTPKGHRPVFISVDGNVRYLRGQDEFAMLSDKPADPLPAATVTGTYVEAPPAYQVTIDRLTPLTVKAKLTQFKVEDSANPAKVKEAILAASPDMFVHFVSRGQTGSAHFAIVPSQFEGIAFGGVSRHSEDKWDPKAKGGLAKFGGHNHGNSEYGSQGNHIEVQALKGYPGALADNTPGLVWDMEGTHATFVTLDGARYRVDLSEAHDKGVNLEAGAGPVSGWPAPLAHGLLNVPQVTSLVKAGALPQKTADELLALDEEWNQCAQKTWKGAQKLIDSGKATENDRKEWVKKVETACKKSVDKQEKMLVQIIEARLKERQATFDAAKGKLGK